MPPKPDPQQQQKPQQQPPQQQQNKGPQQLQAQAQNAGKPNAQQQPPGKQPPQQQQQQQQNQPNKQPPAKPNQLPPLNRTLPEPPQKVYQHVDYSQAYVLQKLETMLHQGAEQEQQVIDYTKKLFQKRNDKHLKEIKEKEGARNENDHRDIQEKLKKWRLKERKQEFQEKIQALTFKEMLPKAVIQKKMQALEQCQEVLEKKDGERELEAKLGVKIEDKYNTIHHLDFQSESPSKDKNYFEKKKEREYQEIKQMQEAEQLLQKLHEEKKQRRELKRKMMKEKKEERLKIVEQKHKLKEEKEKKEIEEKRKELQEKITKIKEERENAIRNMLANTKKINKHPLYKQLEDKEKYQTESNLEQRKRHLQSLRDLHQPLNHDELQERSKRLEEIAKEKLEQRKKEREDFIRAHAQSYDYSKYQSKFLDLVMEQDTVMLEQKEQKEEERKQVQEKRDIYDKYVKEMHWPKVSLKKKQELETLKESMKSPNRNPKSIYGSEHPKNDDGMSYAGGGMKGGNRANSENDGDKGSTKRKKIVWPENPLKPKPKETREAKQIDWLKEQRIKHIQEKANGQSPIKNTQDWKKDLEKMDLQGKEKYDMFLGKAKNFEEKAKRKQEIIGATKGATIEDIIELNDMYVESIKAKLELLNDFN